jgi:hypothetical protein
LPSATLSRVGKGVRGMGFDENEMILKRFTAISAKAWGTYARLSAIMTRATIAQG